MRKNRKNQYSPKSLRTIVLPTTTLAIAGLIFLLSSTYEPNWGFDWRGIRPEMRDSLRLLVNQVGGTSEVVGMAGKTPWQWHRRNWIMQNATEGELRQLIDYPHGVVKLTAYEGLIRKGNADLYPLLRRALQDTTTFYHVTGCTGTRMWIGAYLVEQVVPISDRVPPPPPEKTVAYDLPAEEMKSLRGLYNRLVDREVQIN